MSNLLPQGTIKRIMKDVKDAIKNKLDAQGIYYIHNMDNILNGTAMIIGPKDTPYEDGFYMFNFDFPQNYPYEPPKVTFLTNGDNVRFNPNLYIDGKVCVSILNTWAGEQWTACQSISSILLSIITLLNKEAYLNEPSISSDKHASLIVKYDKLISYYNVKIAICGFLLKQYYTPQYDPFYEIAKKHFIDNYDAIKNKLVAWLNATLRETANGEKYFNYVCRVHLKCYRFCDTNCTLDYLKLHNNLEKTYDYVVHGKKPTIQTTDCLDAVCVNETIDTKDATKL
jgi:ubiquitin-protein ligase